MKIKSKKIYAGKSKLHGKGIFASRDIKKGKIVSLIKGKIVTLAVIDKRPPAYGPNWIGYGKNKWINTLYPFDTINHSCNPNVGIKGSRTVVALRNIKKEEELLIDYSTTESDQPWKLDKKCKCGNKGCRKVVKSIQFLPKKIYNKYMPYIPNFFQGVYKKHNKKNGN